MCGCRKNKAMVTGAQLAAQQQQAQQTQQQQSSAHKLQSQKGHAEPKQQPATSGAR